MSLIYCAHNAAGNNMVYVTTMDPCIDCSHTWEGEGSNNTISVC